MPMLPISSAETRASVPNNRPCRPAVRRYLTEAEPVLLRSSKLSGIRKWVRSKYPSTWRSSSAEKVRCQRARRLAPEVSVWTRSSGRSLFV
ncbi:MAG: hypothetical protein DMF83_03770 [Acidobacteria bacterium]|nr:MAG: hypothetical protein DMF83_03770 [Acidobacteriota bacterium]